MIIESIMNLIPGGRVTPKVHCSLKIFEMRLRFSEPELKVDHDGLF